MGALGWRRISFWATVGGGGVSEKVVLPLTSRHAHWACADPHKARQSSTIAGRVTVPMDCRIGVVMDAPGNERPIVGRIGRKGNRPKRRRATCRKRRAQFSCVYNPLLRQEDGHAFH